MTSLITSGEESNQRNGSWASSDGPFARPKRPTGVFALTIPFQALLGKPLLLQKRRGHSPTVLTSEQCRTRAVELSRLADASKDPAQKLRLEIMAEDWAGLAPLVAAMENWEDRFIHKQDQRASQKRGARG